MDNLQAKGDKNRPLETCGQWELCAPVPWFIWISLGVFFFGTIKKSKNVSQIISIKYIWFDSCHLHTDAPRSLALKGMGGGQV